MRTIARAFEIMLVVLVPKRGVALVCVAGVHSVVTATTCPDEGDWVGSELICNNANLAGVCGQLD